MSQEITRMFATAEAARNAAAELAEEGFSDVHVVTPPAGGDVPVSAIAAQIAQGYVLLADAKIYAQGVAKGGSLVTVHAPFGSGMAATHILNSHGPIASGMPEPEAPKIWDEAAPFSSAMHMSLLSHDPTPASRYMGIAPLTGSGFNLSGAVGMPLLSDNPMPLSSLFGMTSLSKKAAPLSSMLGLPLLTRSKGLMW
jgi:hypothetical protein